MDVEKAFDFDGFKTSFFHFYLPSSYLCFMCSREEFDFFNLGIPPKLELNTKPGKWQPQAQAQLLYVCFIDNLVQAPLSSK